MTDSVSEWERQHGVSPIDAYEWDWSRRDSMGGPRLRRRATSDAEHTPTDEPNGPDEDG